jgi:hypothetical protein
VLLVGARAEAQFRPPAQNVAAEDFHIELGLMFWQPDPELTLTTGDVRVGTVDFVNEFALPNERFREFRGVLKAGRKHKLRFAYVPIKYDQDAVLRRTIVFQNVTFPVNANANATIEWDLYRFGYEWDVIARSHGFVGLIAEVKYNKIKADVTATASVLGQAQSLSEAVDQAIPVPTIGGIARGYLGEYLSVTGEFTGFKLERDEFRGRFYDFDIYGAVHLGKNTGVQAGYRSIDVDVLADSDAGTMKMTGTYFGGFLRF